MSSPLDRMTGFYRPPRASSEKGPDYTLWEARPNSFRPGCYCLRAERRRGPIVRCLNTYFYVDGSGPDLAEVVTGIIEDWSV